MKNVILSLGLCSGLWANPQMISEEPFPCPLEKIDVIGTVMEKVDHGSTVCLKILTRNLKSYYDCWSGFAEVKVGTRVVGEDGYTYQIDILGRERCHKSFNITGLVTPVSF